MSVGLDIETSELARLQQRLLQASNVQFTELLNGLGATVESQTRRRIQIEKTDSKGKAWKQWSEEYAASKHGATNHEPHPGQLRESQGHSILSLRGGLLDSQHFVVGGTEVEIGSNLKYARRQNAEREFLGVSEDNTRDIVEIIDGFLDRKLRPLR